MNSKSDIINKYLSENIVNIIKEKVFLISSIVFSMRLINFIPYPTKLYLLNIKPALILTILCHFIYYNNSNFYFHFMVLYIYFAKAKIGTITLFNYFGLLLFDNIL